jgi:DNA-binding ferritin-like protein (Dps family)
MNQKKNETEDNRPRKKSSLESLSEAYREISPYLWESEPWGLVCGAVLGVILGFYNFFKTVAGSSDKKKQK